MSSPTRDGIATAQGAEEDDPMQGERTESEGEGDVVMPGPGISDDSSEEDEEDEEEERRIREGFIDDDEEEEEEEDEVERERSRRHRKKRKRHHRRREDEDLEEDDLDLLEENTGGAFKKHRLTRLRRGGRDSDSPPASSSLKQRNVVESSDDDLGDDEDLPRVQDIHNIFDDERGRDEEDDMEDINDFIESDDEEDGGVVLDEKAREERRRQRRKEEQERRRMARVAHPELAGIDANAWDEIHDVFGDGHEYDWALDDDDLLQPFLDDQSRSETKYQDIFEPEEIRDRMLTEDDDLIRGQDTPERMQLATSSISNNSTLLFRPPLTVDDLNGAAMWITTRISPRKTRDFFSPDGQYQHLKAALVLAVTFAVRLLFIEEYEVPYMWAHKRDHISHFDPRDARAPRLELLSQAELWRIYSLGQKYRSLVDRRRALVESYERLGLEDKYFEEDIQPAIDSIEMAVDATDWLAMNYKDKKYNNADFHFHDEDEQESGKKHKAPSRVSAYELAKKSIVSKLAQGFGIQPHEVVQNFKASERLHFVEDQELNPTVFAEQFTDLDPSRAQPPEELLRRARMILATELGKDPLLRSQIRQAFRDHGLISVEPTEKGSVAISEHHYYFNFKYLERKTVKDMLESAQFLHILDAESKLLVYVSITLEQDIVPELERRLCEAFFSDSFSEAAKAWNEERTLVVREAIETHLIPCGVKWVREFIREEVEDALSTRYGNLLRKRLDVAPLTTSNMAPGDVPSVVAVSWGKGDPQTDAITIVFLDEFGRMRETVKVDNLVDAQQRDEFIDFLKRRKPDIIVVGGFTMATTKLTQRIKGILSEESLAGSGWTDIQSSTIPVIYVNDDTARIYQHSARAQKEFSALSPIARYCVALARYVQSPLNEFAALGPDITTIAFDADDIDQNIVPKEKLCVAFERALVDVTNKVGVDINRAVTDPYYQRLLSFVCGLGPRKAHQVVEKIHAMGGTLVNRTQFIKGSVMTTKIFLNAASFLRIVQEGQSREPPRADDENAQDPLDSTRIHPEDYELARKMATDALELDEEDTHGYHPSYVVSTIMADAENDKKLSELNLDEFAVSLYEANEDKKRHTLNVIRDELLRPFAEQREPFPPIEPWTILTMLSSETPKTLRVGLIVSIQVVRITKSFVAVRLDSGIEGVINNQYLSDDPSMDPNKLVSKGQTLQGVVIEVKLDKENDHYLVELSSRPSDMRDGDGNFRRIKTDENWNHTRHEKDVDLQQRKKRAEDNKARRIIKHPNFHNFNSSQAEAFLDMQHAGDVVIRPSSKGPQHLAVTWKVDDKLFQHIDVIERPGDFFVDPTHIYADLDELIVNHVQAMARRVEDLTNHDRFKRGSEDELHLYLKNYCAANPAKSMYGFTLNRKRPGHFNLCFLANPKSTVQTWPVRVAPEAYYLFDAAAVGVPELCDAFKVRHLHESQNMAMAVAGAKTPFGAGMRTPARPGHASVRHTERTPNPYSAARTPGRTPNPYGATNIPNKTPNPYNGNPTSVPARVSSTPNPYSGAAGASTGPTLGYQTPRAGMPQPPLLPGGMNPERAAMIQQAGGWSQGSGSWT